MQLLVRFVCPSQSHAPASPPSHHLRTASLHGPGRRCCSVATDARLRRSLCRPCRHPLMRFLAPAWFLRVRSAQAVLSLLPCSSAPPRRASAGPGSDAAVRSMQPRAIRDPAMAAGFANAGHCAVFICARLSSKVAVTETHRDKFEKHASSKTMLHSYCCVQARWPEVILDRNVVYLRIESL
jgi:hypothetical protein